MIGFGYFPALIAKFVFFSTSGREQNLKEEKASLKKHVKVLERALEEKTKQGIYLNIRFWFSCVAEF